VNGRSEPEGSSAPPVAETGPTPRPPDPLGRRALFWAAGGEPAGTREHRAGQVPLGKRALFSAASVPDDELGREASENPLTGRGPVVVGCSSCGAVTRVSLVDLLFLQFPIGFWLPRGRFDHRMTCPSCQQRVWASVTLRRG